MSGDPIEREEFVKRLAGLCASGVGPGMPRRSRDAQILLASMALCFQPGRRYTEREVGEALQSWLEAAGPRVDLDHASMRRALVDGRYLDRDARGTTYQRSAVNPERIAPEWMSLDPLYILQEARANAERRKQSMRSGQPRV
ncbi:MAG TPA: DUF2087 domain-containing protein [bacterium]|nr:DUF2087 domain-containing protein [bacterium]